MRLTLTAPLTLKSGTYDAAERTISGYAYTTETDFEAADETGKLIKARFSKDAEVVLFRDHVPVTLQHDRHALVGRIANGAKDDKGWLVDCSIAKTPRGDEALALADAGAYGGLSMEFWTDEYTEDEGVLVISKATCHALSLVDHPAIQTAVIAGVALAAPIHEGMAEMPPENDNASAVQMSAEQFTELINTLKLSTPEAPTAIPLVGKTKSESPYPHLFGAEASKNSWFADMEAAKSNPEGAAAERLKLHAEATQKRSMKLAVTTDNKPPSDPPNNDSLFYNTEPDPLQPLQGLVSTGTMAPDQGPMYVPYYDSTGEANLVNPHVEGVEPALGDIGTFGRQLVEPGAVSGKVAATRETTFNPLYERIIWKAFTKAGRAGVEAALATMLDGLTLPGDQVKTVRSNGTGADAGRSVDDVLGITRSMLFNPEGTRYSRLLLTQNTYNDLATAKDSTGRFLLNVSGQAVNSAGANNAGGLDIGGSTGRPIVGVTNSYLIDPDVVHVLLSKEYNWTFDYEVAWVRYGYFRASMMFITDTRGVIRLTRSTS